ncbi:4-methyl-5(beta-hydroxyethyl)-thiazole monophosphate synthesis protein, putative [Leishmania tarentolae]|uniref:4-methyl-5(Beta-hydroxyethyl)-thiazole monophosphate synthesis protein, putative n=1 Tax=Leishmania tarentolae TaxID=5689 RepID=A0A640KT78_LEITA|nr:4-methyl-5(beta-hydroxyethyl)-thiazole monophosphate synthesis protein, putative [Leishmania tarentolae]
MNVLVVAADHSEDIELISIIDVLSRAEIKVTLASVMESKSITLAHGVNVQCDALIGEVSADNYDAVLLPGGMPGSVHLGNSEALKKILHDARLGKKLYGGICAAPVVSLAPMGLLDGVDTATCYPGFEDKLPSSVKYSTNAVVKSGNCLTSRGPGTAIYFGLAVVSILKSPDLAERLAKAMLVDQSKEMDDVRAIK